MANIAKVPCQVLLDAHLCQQPSGGLMALLFVIQSSCTDTDVLELWPQTSNVGVDDNGDLYIIYDYYNFFIFIYQGKIYWQ